MISWHLVLLLGVVIFFIYRIWYSNNENDKGGYFGDMDLITPIWIVGLIIILVIYGGIFWW